MSLIHLSLPADFLGGKQGSLAEISVDAEKPRLEFESRVYAFTLITDQMCGVVYCATRNHIPCLRLVGIPKDEHLRILTQWPAEEGALEPRQQTQVCKVHRKSTLRGGKHYFCVSGIWLVQYHADIDAWNLRRKVPDAVLDALEDLAVEEKHYTNLVNMFLKQSSWIKGPKNG